MVTLVPEIEEALQRLFGLYTPLKEDTDQSWKSVIHNRSDSSLRRGVVRTTFAFIEGATFGLKQLLLSLHKPGVELTLEETTLLREHRYELDAHGRAFIRQARLDVKSNVRFAFSVAPRFLRGAPIDASSKGWKDFSDALAIRHRLTHPKQASDLVVTDSELLTVNRAYVWFHNTLTALFRGSTIEPSKAKVIEFPVRDNRGA